jgi:hypothetical protein
MGTLVPPKQELLRQYRALEPRSNLDSRTSGQWIRPGTMTITMTKKLKKDFEKQENVEKEVEQDPQTLIFEHGPRIGRVVWSAT